MLGQPASFCFPFLFAERYFFVYRVPRAKVWTIFFFFWFWVFALLICVLNISIISLDAFSPFPRQSAFCSATTTYLPSLKFVSCVGFSCPPLVLLFSLALISVCWESKTKRELLTFDSGDG